MRNLIRTVTTLGRCPFGWLVEMMDTFDEVWDPRDPLLSGEGDLLV